LNNFPQFLKTKIRNLIMLRATPREIATGFAIGVFIGIFPTFGLGFLLILAIAAFWKFNVPAALVGTLAGNPLLSPLWITLSCLVVRINPNELRMPEGTFFHIVGYYSRLGLWYLLGNAAISLAAALLAYFAVFRLVKWYVKRRRTRNLLTKQ
jgi:hypothetical protein